MKSYLLVFVVFILGGCAVATGPKFTPALAPEEDHALIYVYREVEFQGGAISPKVMIGNEITQGVQNGGYLYTYIPSGVYDIGIEMNNRTEKYTFNSGETYYFKARAFYEESYMSYSHYFTIKLIDSEVGSKEIIETRLVSQNSR